MATQRAEIPADETMSVYCAGSCSGQTEHDVLARVNTQDSDENMSWWSGYQILGCRGCKTISFRQSSSNSEADHYQVGDNEWVVDESVKLYPPRTADTRGLSSDDIYYLPEMLVGIYEETRSALINAMPVLAGIGLRAIVETLCKDQKVTGNNLQQQIDALVTTGLMTKQQAGILHKIRTLGNKAAHEVVPHPADQLGLAMNVVEHLLEGTYIVPAKVAKIFPDPKPASIGVPLAPMVAIPPAQILPVILPVATAP
jgi:hypothetical protein